MSTFKLEDYRKHIAHCFILISNKLSRGSIASWDTHDFKILSESIHEETGTLLSVSTLKRLSGRIHYGSKPNNSTLDTLAKYVGFEDWRSFLKSFEPTTVKKNKITTSTRVGKYGLVFLLLVMVVSSYFLLRSPLKYYDSNDFSFSVKSVTTGIPNSVVFKYDASIADKKTKIEIQQDWDKRKRVVVNKNDSILTSSYYKPGFFKSKLVVNDSIVKEEDVFIPSNDWLATIETDSLPIYLDLDNELSINVEKLKIHGIDPYKEKTVVGLYQVKDFGELYTDEFELTTSFRNDFQSGITPCQVAQLTILHEGGPIAIPVCNKGCISDISLFAFDEQINGKNHDLSNLGVDYTNYVNIKCISRDQKLIILVNEKPVYTLNVPQPYNKIIGICFFFEGTGSVNYVRLKKDGQIIYDSEHSSSSLVEHQ
ncbi:hypothetical protein [Flagellimonas taeanensis]|uniref:hypothetical protein n=1 Tax=Flagellimonas taeanensis TaxID=1005926 RepID=UPI00116077F9|nr:hypothetical protein [Allomuricauda taeanensis]